jgi:hypothetical protein
LRLGYLSLGAILQRVLPLTISYFALTAAVTESGGDCVGAGFRAIGDSASTAFEIWVETRGSRISTVTTAITTITMISIQPWRWSFGSSWGDVGIIDPLMMPHQ